MTKKLNYVIEMVLFAHGQITRKDALPEEFATYENFRRISYSIRTIKMVS